MYIQHTHPAAQTPEAKAETLSALYRACVSKLRSPDLPWAFSQGKSPVPSAQ